MGVHGLWQLLQPAGKPIALESLEGKILAVDVSIWLNKAAKGMRDKFGDPVYNAHLIVIFQRLCKLLFYKVRPIFVFDGGVPELKKKTISARRERKLTAGGKVQKARRKILHNYLKGKALETVTGQRGPRIVNEAARNVDQDLFALPPLVASNEPESSSEEEDNVNAESEWIAEMRSDRVEKMFEEIGSVDIDAEEFRSLPSEIQHEILMEMKDSYRRRYNRRKTQEMPEGANDFSDFQLKNLFRRGKITQKIDDVRKEMKTKSSGQIADMEEEIILQKNIKSVEANRIASEDKHHYILLKKEEKIGGNVLFNTKIEKDKLEIYEGIKRNESFDRLEREPVQFSTSSIDQSNIVSFMSDSTDDSDFDKEFLLSDVQKFTAGFIEGHVGHGKSQRDNFEGQGTKASNADLSTHDESKTFGSNMTESMKTSEVILSSSEDSCEDLHSSKAKSSSIIVVKDDNQPMDERNLSMESSDFEKSSEKETCLDEQYADTSIKMTANSADQRNSNTSHKSEVCSSSIELTVSNDKDFGDKSHSTVMTATGSNRLLEDTAALNAESAFKTEREMILLKDREPTRSERLDSPKTEAVVLSEEGQSDNAVVPCTVPNEDVSAIPKPDSAFDVGSEINHEIDEGELREFRNAVKDCKSVEELDSLKKTLTSERNQLLRERERQSRAAASVGNEEYNDVQELLHLFGIPYIISPMEAEAQCAVLDLSNQTHGSITDDSDILLFGGKRVYKNIFNQDKYAELYTVENIGHMLFLDREKMIALAYLTGSDYTEGIQGVGVITAMEILQEFGGGSMQSLVNLKNWYEEVKSKGDVGIFEEETKLKSKMRLLEIPNAFPNHKVWEAYINPTADYSEEPFEWGKPDLDAIREFAQHKFGWRSFKTDEILLPAIKRLYSNQSQTTLRRYFTETIDTTKRKVSSKRLQRTVHLMRSGVTSSELPTPKHNKKARVNTLPQAAASNASGVVPNFSSETLKSMSFKKRRVPSNKDFQKRVAKSKASSVGRVRRLARPALSGDGQRHNKNSIISRKIDLSESSSDSES